MVGCESRLARERQIKRSFQNCEFVLFIFILDRNAWNINFDHFFFRLLIVYILMMDEHGYDSVQTSVFECATFGGTSIFY